MSQHPSNAFLRALVICFLAIGMTVSNVSLVVYSPSVANAALTQPGERATSPSTAIGFNKAVYKKDAVAPTGGGVWTTGDAGKNYRENQWVFYQYQITGVNSTTIVDFNVAFNHLQTNTSAIFVDAFANFRACLDATCDDTNASGPMANMLMDGVPYPTTSTTNWKVVPVPSVISHVNYAFDPGTSSCSSADALNTPTELHCFSVNGTGLATLVGLPATGSHTVTLFYEAHLASSAVWQDGLEASIGMYDGVGAEALPAGTLYGTDVYAGWTTTAYNGAGYATGSSRHFTLEGPGGAITLPIPAVPAPTGSITITKATSPSAATGVSFAFTGTFPTFTLDTDPSATYPNTKTFTALGGGFPFTFTESAPASGWTLTDLTCTSSKGTNQIVESEATRTATITLDLDGGIVACTFTNEQGTFLTLAKHVVNDAGGTANASAWTLAATGTSGSFSGTGTPATGTDASLTHQVTAGVQYTLSESGTPTGYTAGTTWSCTGDTAGYVSPNKITLQAGQSATCTITNTDNDPQLHLRKTVVNDNGGTAVAANWTLTATGASASPTNLSGATPVDSGAGFKADTYTLGETGPSGYAGTWSCGTATMTDGTHVVVPLGGDVTCTVTNDDIAAHLIVIKHVVNGSGGTAVASDFTITINSVTASGGNSFPGAESPGTDKTLTSVGSYSVSEVGPAGYQDTFSADCTGTIALGETKTCTITNENEPAHLIVIKHVINDNGGTATASAWTMTITGPTASGGNSFAGAESPGVDKTLTSVGSYSVSESATPAGYTVSYSADCTGTIALGETKTCTVTNNDTPAHLIVIKHVVNDNGGTAVASAWTMGISGPTASGGNTFAGAESPGVDKTLTSVGSYSIGESGGPAGYSDTYSVDCSGTIALGETKTCTITNDDIAPVLHLRKTVVNDNGGTAVAGSWTLTATGPTTLSGHTPVDSGATFSAGTYTLAESDGATGYSTTGWSCVKNSAAPVTGASVTLGLGDTATCTIINDDIAAHLIVIKHVVNDNDGSENSASAWTMTINGLTAVGGTSFAGAESPGVDKTLTSVGGYSVTEDGPANYTPSYSTDCTGTIALGQTKTCTVTNDDNAPGLHLRKIVVNDNGGTALNTDWTLTATGTTTLSGHTPVDSGSTFVAGTYTLSESGGPSGYTASSWVCEGGTQRGSSVTVALGDSVTCTITNDDIPPALHLRKEVTSDNGGSAAATDWLLSATGPTPMSGSTPVDSDATFAAGTYALAESGGDTGYSAGAWSCGEATMTDATHVVVGLGDDITCTITNDDIAAHLIVIKHVVGGQNVASDFTMTIDGVTAAGGQSFAGQESPGTDKTLTTIGDYSVSETGLPYYDTSYSADCAGTIALGETKTCTVTNTFNPPMAHLTLVKTVTNTGGGTALPTAWTLSATGPSTISGTSGSESVTGRSVEPGTYALAESGGPSNYTPGTWSCVFAERPTAQAPTLVAAPSVTLAYGESATCTINNTFIPNNPTGTLTITKYNDLNGNGTRDAGEPALSGWTFGLSLNGFSIGTLTTDATGSATRYGLASGSYAVVETLRSGWYSTDPGTATPTKVVVVTAGQTSTVLFGNREALIPPTSQGGTIAVTKYEDANASKARDTGEAGLSGWAFTIRNDQGAVVATITTDASGRATAVDLQPGVYTVTETTQTGWVSTDPGGSAPSKQVLVEAGQTIAIDFGNAKVQLPSTSTEGPALEAYAMLAIALALGFIAIRRSRA